MFFQMFNPFFSVSDMNKKGEANNHATKPEEVFAESLKKLYHYIILDFDTPRDNNESLILVKSLGGTYKRHYCYKF